MGNDWLKTRWGFDWLRGLNSLKAGGTYLTKGAGERRIARRKESRYSSLAIDRLYRAVTNPALSSSAGACLFDVKAKG